MTRRSARRAALVAAGVALLCSAAPVAQADPGTVDVVLTLRPADQAALARATHLPPNAAAQARRAALAAARPTGAGRVTAYLEQHGFAVTANDGWTIAARGRADVARALHHPDVAGVSVPGGGHAWHRRTIPGGYTGSTLAKAYDVVGGTGSGVTVATVQFSGWDPDDLTTYAGAANVADPNPVEVAVGTADPTDTSSGGDFEVALDQEVLLAAAPAAGQRIYFSRNDPDTAMQDALLLYSRIATDAEAGLVDVVSTSWGMCEPYADEEADSRAGIETALARIVAAGATVFAAAGDMGAYDCDDPTITDPTVDYPASSSYVVGVGGTTLTANGSGWNETVWSQPTEGLGGGGGASSSVARPSWQSAVGISGTKRLVPDVAAMADPRNGFGAYAASVGGWVLGGGTSAGAPLLAGHLAATLSANGRTTGVGDIHDELYANPTAFRDVTSGNNLLYDATAGYDRASGLGAPKWSAIGAALFGNPVVTAPPVTGSLTVPVTVNPPTGVTITHWTTGEGSGIACDPNGSATPPTEVVLPAGNDRVTRVAVAALDDTNGCRVGSAPVVYDTHAPASATASIQPYRYDARTVFSWGATDPSPSSGLTYDVCVYALGSGCVWTRTGTTGRTASLSLSQGRTYVLRVTPVDRAGNRGVLFTSARYAVPLDQSQLARSTGWSRTASGSDWYGSHYASGKRGAYLSKYLVGTRYSVMYVARPTGGTFDLYVSGHFVKRISTYAATTTYRKVALVASYSTHRSRAVRIVVHSGSVAIDAVRVTY